MIKVLEKAGIQNPYINTIKAMYTKSIANIKLNGEKLKTIPLKLGQDKVVYFLSLQYSI
jgi:phosphatidate phosphatase PAH1